MLGVVLWSDSSDRKAVVWCEDQGDLAFVSGEDSVLNADDFFDAGDLIQFDMRLRNSTRHACNPRLVVEKAGTCLPVALKNSAKRQRDVDAEHGEVLPFARPVKETFTPSGKAKSYARG